MTSCRGILVSGMTNVARTQMTEALLRALTGGRVFVASGGVRHCAAVHPFALSVMADAGMDLSSHAVSSLDSARRQRGTYDVYVSVDAPYARRTADRFQARAGPAPGEAAAGADLGPLLAPAAPAHWECAADGSDAQQRWTLWSPRDPAIFHETSTRKLQDFLYEGEPLFMLLRPSRLRLSAAVSERWEMEELAQRYAAESARQQRQRFAAARDELARRSLALLRRLEEHYGEDLVTDARLARAIEEESTIAQGTAQATPSSSATAAAPARSMYNHVEAQKIKGSGLSGYVQRSKANASGGARVVYDDEEQALGSETVNPLAAARTHKENAEQEARLAQHAALREVRLRVLLYRERRLAEGVAADTVERECREMTRRLAEAQRAAAADSRRREEKKTAKQFAAAFNVGRRGGGGGIGVGSSGPAATHQPPPQQDTTKRVRTE